MRSTNAPTQRSLDARSPGSAARRLSAAAAGCCCCCLLRQPLRAQAGCRARAAARRLPAAWRRPPSPQPPAAGGAAPQPLAAPHSAWLRCWRLRRGCRLPGAGECRRGRRRERAPYRGLGIKRARGLGRWLDATCSGLGAECALIQRPQLASRWAHGLPAKQPLKFAATGPLAPSFPSSLLQPTAHHVLPRLRTRPQSQPR